MNATYSLEHALTPTDVVDAVARCLGAWTDDEFAQVVPGERKPEVQSVEDIEEWADRLQRHACTVPLLEPEESGREQLMRLFLLASVKVRQAGRAGRLPVAAAFRFRPAGPALVRAA